MRYLFTSKGGTQEPDETLYAEMGAFVEELTKSGVLLATGGMQLEGTLVTMNDDGEITVTDGPFTEAKEAAGGFALVEVRSREEALEIARRFLKITHGGESHLRQIFG